jgi:hypothetical protein
VGPAGLNRFNQINVLQWLTVFMASLMQLGFCL